MSEELEKQKALEWKQKSQSLDIVRDEVEDKISAERERELRLKKRQERFYFKMDDVDTSNSWNFKCICGVEGIDGINLF